MVESWLGLDKICLKKLSKMSSQKKETILQAKWAANFVKKSKMATISEDVSADNCLVEEPYHIPFSHPPPAVAFGHTTLWIFLDSNLITLKTS